MPTRPSSPSWVSSTRTDNLGTSQKPRTFRSGAFGVPGSPGRSSARPGRNKEEEDGEPSQIGKVIVGRRESRKIMREVAVEGWSQPITGKALVRTEEDVWALGALLEILEDIEEDESMILSLCGEDGTWSEQILLDCTKGVTTLRAIFPEVEEDGAPIERLPFTEIPEKLLVLKNYGVHVKDGKKAYGWQAYMFRDGDVKFLLKNGRTRTFLQLLRKLADGGLQLTPMEIMSYAGSKMSTAEQQEIKKKYAEDLRAAVRAESLREQKKIEYRLPWDTEGILKPYMGKARFAKGYQIRAAFSQSYWLDKKFDNNTQKVGA
jgi:hypothetical protein